MKKTLRTGVTIAAVTIILLLTQACSSAAYSSEDERMEKITTSAQYNDGEFVNYEKNPGVSFWRMMSFLWQRIFVDYNGSPDYPLPVQQIDFTKITSAEPDELRVTWVGHSSQIINMDGLLILTDPIYENSTAFMGPSRYNGDVPMNIDELPPVDIVLISHNHYDHFNSFTIEQIHERVQYFIVPLMVGAQLEELGVPRDKIIEMDWWDEVTLFDDFLIALTPTQHFSGRGMFDRNETLWGSFVVDGPYHKIYFSGDTGYSKSFKEIGDKYGPFDYTFLECGAYNERWEFVHLLPEQTAQAHLDLRGELLHPIHWGTFDLGLHAWFDPMIRVARAADSLDIKLSTPFVGQTIIVNDDLVTTRWWERSLPQEYPPLKPEEKVLASSGEAEPDEPAK